MIQFTKPLIIRVKEKVILVCEDKNSRLYCENQ
nr:MAG TPA: hypothetical protein [Caudoviricetes sp.]